MTKTFDELLESVNVGDTVTGFLKADLKTIHHQELQAARQDGYNAGLADGTDRPLLAIEQMIQKVREQRKGWKGYVVVDPKADNYKYSPIYMDRREATLWLAENGDDDLEVAEVDILLAHQSELDQHTV